MSNLIPVTLGPGIQPVISAYGKGARPGVDSTTALQAAIDQCFGSSSNPHGLAGVADNLALFIDGRYQISSPLVITKAVGAKIFGNGRFTSGITNTSGGPVFTTNGFSYSSIEGLRLQTADASPLIELDWDNSSGGGALQSNTFANMYFQSGSHGVRIGNSGYMGSENLFLNCAFDSHSVAGIETRNYNALQQSVIGGNFQSCAIGIYIYAGSVPVIHGVGFQISSQYDIKAINSSPDMMDVAGCRSESVNFISLQNGHAASISACNHQGSADGIFLYTDGHATVDACASVKGVLQPVQASRVSVRGSRFDRADWIQPLYPFSSAGRAAYMNIELENVQYGATPTIIQRRRVIATSDETTTQNLAYTTT